MVTLGTKNLMNGLGQKAKDAIVKGVKVASVGAAAVGVAKAITSVAGSRTDVREALGGVNPNAVRSRSGAGAVSFLTGGRY